MLNLEFPYVNPEIITLADRNVVSYCHLQRGHYHRIRTLRVLIFRLNDRFDDSGIAFSIALDYYSGLVVRRIIMNNYLKRKCGFLS